MKIYNQVTAPYGGNRPNSAACLVLSRGRVIYMSMFLADRLGVDAAGNVGIIEDGGELYICPNINEGWGLHPDRKGATGNRLRIYSSFVNNLLRGKCNFGNSATIFIPVSNKYIELDIESEPRKCFAILTSAAYLRTKRGV